MIKLRPLEKKDAIEMLAFTVDIDTKKNTNFLYNSNSISNFENFILNSLKETKSLHYAIDYNGKYAGTVSLKNLNRRKKNAEFAIIVHPNFRGKGIGQHALMLIIEKAKYENFESIFLNVFEENTKAITLYHKVGFKKYFTSFRINKFENKKKKLIWMKKIL